MSWSPAISRLVNIQLNFESNHMFTQSGQSVAYVGQAFDCLTDSLVKMLEGPAPTKEVLQELHFSIRRFGCRFNLYTDFLERGGKRFPQNERSEQLKSLASYILVSQRGVH